jgi:tol-pal system protein YbgF
MMRGRFTKAALILTAGLGLGLAASPSYAQSASDLQARLQRVERDMRDIQAEIYRRNPNGPIAPPPAAAPEPQQAMPDLGPLMRRLDELEGSITRLTGQMEELGHQVELVNQKTDRLQKDLDYQAMQAAEAAAAAAAAMPPSDMPNDAVPPGDAIASAAPPDAPLAPAAGTLGQIPADTPLPRPGRPAPAANAPTVSDADMRREFDAAMNLLSRAQYDQASEAFHTFADMHPEDDRAGAAVYWAGDIAYSVKKDYEEAARDFAALLKSYPKAARAPEGMLKLGLSLIALNQTKEGCAALAALPARYPDASATIATRARNERRDNKCR